MIYRLTTKNRLDKRSLAYKWAEYYKANTNAVHGALVLGTLLALIFAPWIWRKTRPLTFEGVNPTIASEPASVELPDSYYLAEPLRYIRFRGEQLGVDEYTITRFIKVAMCESNLNPDALNKNRNGTFDVGIYQINSVHKQTNMTNFVKNIDYAYELFLDQGFTPWNSSKRCWQ
jgi:hypothetical protein